MAHRRAHIRNYITDLLKEEIDVGGRVFSCRPDPVFIEETPCALVYYADEGAQTYVGDRYNQKTIERLLRVNVDVWQDQVIDPDADPRLNQEGEDRLDFLGWQVENAMFGDQKLAKLLDDYDPNTNYLGLSLGMALISCTPYDVDTDGNTRVLAQRMTFEIPYETEAFEDKKFKSFTEYKAEIYRADYDENTVDPILTSAEGTI